MGAYSGKVDGYLARDTFSLPSISNIIQTYFVAGTKASGDIFTANKFPAHGALGLNYKSFTDSYSIITRLYDTVPLMEITAFSQIEKNSVKRSRVLFGRF